MKRDTIVVLMALLAWCSLAGAQNNNVSALQWQPVVVGPLSPYVMQRPWCTTPPCADFDVLTASIGPILDSLKVWVQGGISDLFAGGPVEPMDLSQNVIQAN